jgi:hypothetical protein
MEFLSYGSPKLRYVLNETLTYVFPATPKERREKLLLVEDIPLSAEFWEMVVHIR